MSVATEISRIQTDRNTIRNTLIEWGQAQAGDNLDALAAAIASLQNRGAVDAEVQEGQTYTIRRYPGGLSGCDQRDGDFGGRSGEQGHH